MGKESAMTPEEWKRIRQMIDDLMGHPGLRSQVSIAQQVIKTSGVEAALEQHNRGFLSQLVDGIEANSAVKQALGGVHTQLGTSLPRMLELTKAVDAIQSSNLQHLIPIAERILPDLMSQQAPMFAATTVHPDLSRHRDVLAKTLASTASIQAQLPQISGIAEGVLTRTALSAAARMVAAVPLGYSVAEVTESLASLTNVLGPSIEYAIAHSPVVEVPPDDWLREAESEFLEDVVPGVASAAKALERAAEIEEQPRPLDPGLVWIARLIEGWLADEIAGTALDALGYESRDTTILIVWLWLIYVYDRQSRSG